MRALLIACLIGTGLLLSACGDLVAVGSGVACVVRADGTPTCFGASGSGQAGHDAGAAVAPPAAVTLPARSGVGDLAIGIGAPNGQAAACASVARKGAGTQVRCWGDDTYGVLGRGAAGAPSATPVPVRLSSDPLDVSVGATFACAVVGSDGVACWGDNASGQLGDRSSGIHAPGIVNGTTSLPTTGGASSSPNIVAAGAQHACAAAGPTIVCWGLGTSGQLGNGSAATSAAPVRVALPKGVDGVGEIGAGGATSCAIASLKRGGNAAWCWGANESGQLGNGTTTSSASPVQVDLGTRSPTQISVGGAHACAIADDATVWCWGANAAGQLGNGTTTASATPVQVPGLQATLVAAGADSTCASTTAGRLRCWGANAQGQLGVAPTLAGSSPTPLTVPGIDDLRAPKPRAVKVTGSAAIGGRLTVAPPSWPYAAGYEYRWQRRGADGAWEDIDRAERASLRITAGLAGALVRVTVTGTNAWTEAGVVPSTPRASAARRIAG